MMSISSRTSDAAVVRFYQMYRGPLLCYIYYRIHDFDEAEDMVQEVFLRLLTYEMRLDEKTVKSFLFTIARNLIVDYLRHTSTKTEKMADLCFEMEETSPQRADTELLYHETLRIYRTGKEQLSPKARQVYEMSFEQDMSIDEISKGMDVAYKTVECHLFLARKKMRSYVWQALAV